MAILPDPPIPILNARRALAAYEGTAISAASAAGIASALRELVGYAQAHADIARREDGLAKIEQLGAMFAARMGLREATPAERVNAGLATVGPICTPEESAAVRRQRDEERDDADLDMARHEALRLRAMLDEAVGLLDTPERDQDADWYAARDDIAQAVGLPRSGRDGDPDDHEYIRAVQARRDRGL